MTTPRRYKPNPDARIYAIEWTGDLDELPSDWQSRDVCYLDEESNLVVRTNQGLAVGYVGWFLIFGTAAEFYPVPPAIFHGRWILDD
jgi:hypothetical protein